jgi:hypothetical protein
MKKGRLLFAAALLAVTSAFLVSGSLPVVSIGAGASDATQGKIVRLSGTYGKVEQ